MTPIERPEPIEETARMNDPQTFHHGKSAVHVFGLIGLAVVMAVFGLVLAFFGAIVISGCIGECSTPDPSGSLPFFVGAALAGATSTTSTYWMISDHHRRAGLVFAATALTFSIPLAMWAVAL